MNPGDVFPRRNLPGAAEEWGRTVEERIRDAEREGLRAMGSSRGLNRTTASTLQDLASQVLELDALYRSIPKPAQATGQATGFGLSGGWNTVLTTSIPVPTGVSRVDLLAVGSGQLVSGATSGSQYRLEFVGVGTSPAAPGAWHAEGTYRTVMAPSYSWQTDVTPGTNLSVRFQVQPNETAPYSPNANSYAVLSLLATFTG
jgi:hypothetical protein